MLDRGRLQMPLAWRRRAMQSTYLFAVALSGFLLFEYASYLTGGAEDLQDHSDLEIFPDTSLDTVYLPFRPPPQPAAPSRKLKPSTLLPASCLDAHISKGELCYNPAHPRFDVLWTWVNGSDILLQDAKARVEEGLPADDPYRPNRSWKQVRQFRYGIPFADATSSDLTAPLRDHDELRFSLRSVLANFRPYIDRFHVLSSDFAIPPNENVTAPVDWRLGQVPQWLKTATAPWVDGRVQLQMKHHAQIFQP